MLALPQFFCCCTDDITEDRMLALRKRAEVDSKYVISFASYDDYELKQSLHKYARLPYLFFGIGFECYIGTLCFG